MVVAEGRPDHGRGRGGRVGGRAGGGPGGGGRESGLWSQPLLVVTVGVVALAARAVDVAAAAAAVVNRGGVGRDGDCCRCGG